MITRSLRTICKTAFLLLLIVSNSAFADEPLKLEITLVDNENPGQSVAIINGESVKRNDQISGYQIISIGPSSVTLKNLQTGAESVLSPASAEMPKVENAVPPAEIEKPSAQPQKNAFTEFLQTPQKLMNRFWELRGLRDLAIVNNAAVSFQHSKNQFPKTFNDLIQANFLPAVYQSGIKEKYRFYFIVPPDPKDFGVHADPLDSASGLRSFYIGTDTVIRESAKGPAGPKSAPHAY